MTQTTTHVSIRVAIAVGSDPIAGVVTVGDAPPREFETWFELIAALDGARAPASKDQGATLLRRGSGPT